MTSLAPFTKIRNKIYSNWKTSITDFKSNPWNYLSIPIVAAIVGYITNWVGVKMLFQPYNWVGIPIKRWTNQPFGLLGFQGIVPAKRVAMASRMVDVTLNRLLKISEVFGKLDPTTVANLIFPTIHKAFMGGLIPKPLIFPFLKNAVVDVLKNIENIVDIKSLVVDGMTTDPKILGSFFQQVGKRELAFLVESGVGFGFLLGVFQMLQWMVYPAQWTLPVCGAFVGYVTNWIALKWVFEPLVPTKIGPFILHGMFLQRQKEVSRDFSNYLSANILTSQNIWKSILEGPKSNEFVKVLSDNVPLPSSFVLSIVSILQRNVGRVLSHPLHKYTDYTINIREILIQKMNLLSPAEFEQVLHPIFQEDEFLLIMAGGVLGAVAGGLQWCGNIYFEKKAAKNNAKLLLSLNSSPPVTGAPSRVDSTTNIIISEKDLEENNTKDSDISAV